MLSRVVRASSADHGAWEPPPADTVFAVEETSFQPREAPAANIEKRLHDEREKALQEGWQSAINQARAEVEPLKTQLARSIADVAGMKARLRAEAEQDIVRLSLAIARKILHREACVDPDAILGIVKAALARLTTRETSRVRVHPGDVESLRRHAGSGGFPQSIEIAGDPVLSPGSVIFETIRGSLDASIESQLAEIERGFADLLERK